MPVRVNVKSTHELPASCCTACKKELDRASGVGNSDKPEPDDITICLTCGHIMAFDDDLSLRDLTEVEIYNAAGDYRIIAVQNARKKMQEKKTC